MQPTETGKRIQISRKHKGWTQKDLADRICVSDKAVSKWERGLNYPVGCEKRFVAVRCPLSSVDRSGL